MVPTWRVCVSNLQLKYRVCGKGKRGFHLSVVTSIYRLRDLPDKKKAYLIKTSNTSAES